MADAGRRGGRTRRATRAVMRGGHVERVLRREGAAQTTAATSLLLVSLPLPSSPRRPRHRRYEKDSFVSQVWSAS